MSGPEGGYLLDTSVLSAAAPDRRGVTPDEAKERARAWLLRHDDRLYLSAVALGETAAGIGLLDARPPSAGGARTAALAAWLGALLTRRAGRILAFDAACAAEMRHAVRDARRANVEPTFPDLAIAATARRHGLVVATRDLRDFALLGVRAVDPYAAE